MPAADGAPEVLVSSDKLGWPDVLVEVRRKPAVGYAAPPLDRHLVGLVTGRAVAVEQVRGGRRWAGKLTPGEVVVVPAGSPGRWAFAAPAEVACVFVAPGLVARAAADAGTSGQVAHVFAARDPDLAWAAGRLADEARAPGPAGRLYADALAGVLAVRLARRSAAPRPAAALDPGRLRRAVEYLDAHLTGDPTLADVAAAVGLSRFHFARAFRAATGLPPHRFLVARRVDRAKALLADPRLPLADVALRAGFAGQSHLTRHFTRLVGVSPGRYRAATSGNGRQPGERPPAARPA